MQALYYQIIENMRSLMARILEPKLDLDDFLMDVTRAAKQLDPDRLEARVYEVDFIENHLILKTSTQLDVEKLDRSERIFTILPKTITGDAIIENRVILGSRTQGYDRSRFVEAEEERAAFPIEYYDVEMPEGRTKYVLVVDKKGRSLLDESVLAALRDYAILAGLAISIKELRDRLSRYFEENKNLALTGRHSASIAHDIKSLNIGVGGYLKLAQRIFNADQPHKDVHKAREYLDMAVDNSRQIEALLDNFTQFSRREIVLNRDTDLLDAVSEKLDSLRHRIDYGRLVRFRKELPDKPTGFMVDRDWFGTVVENLVRNSLEACNGKTTIRVRLESESDKIRLIFEDDCGGIPDNILPEIFNPFRTSKKRGQGLGLANARKVIHDHGGVIEAQNNGGQGAAFTILFDRNPDSVHDQPNIS
jgi:signal transduction histidine kinase